MRRKIDDEPRPLQDPVPPLNFEPRNGRPHEKLQCWKDAIDLVVSVYKATSCFPPSEQYALTSQMRRAAVSVPSNVAEGVARRGDAERRQFLLIARGSLSELETQLIIAERLGYLAEATTQDLLALSGKVGAMLNGLLRRFSCRPPGGSS